MNDRLPGAEGTPSRFSPTRVKAALAGLKDVAELSRRVAELESEMQEQRRLNRRLAELTDVVQELLVPLARRDEAKLREHLDRYSSSL